MQVRRRLLDGGVSQEVANDLVPRFEQAAEALPRTTADEASVRAFFVPGRIEVLGKHTDYAGGSSLTCATQRGLCLVAAPSTESVLHVHRAVSGEVVDLDLTSDESIPEGHWTTYPLTVIRRVRQNFDVDLTGGHVAFSSTLPQAAGMSSSSAMVVAFFEVLRALNALHEHSIYREYLSRPEAKAEYLGAIESGEAYGPFADRPGVGTFGGSEDHTAILCSVPGRLRKFSYRPTRLEDEVPLPGGHAFVVADSGVSAEKTGAEKDRYNRASRLAARAAQVWRTAMGRDDSHLGAAVASDAFSPDRMRKVLMQADSSFGSDELIRRFDHFYTEHCQILPAAVDALRDEDLDAFGRQVDRSQHAAEELLGNQVPETSFLAREARTLGATAASSFGAGFGGSVWALVPERKVSAFRDSWASRYEDAFPEAGRRAAFFVEHPGPAAFEL